MPFTKLLSISPLPVATGILELTAPVTPLAASPTAVAPENNFPATPPNKPLISPDVIPFLRLPVSIVVPKPEPIAPAPNAPKLPNKVPAPAVAPKPEPSKPKSNGKNASG